MVSCQSCPSVIEKTVSENKTLTKYINYHRCVIFTSNVYARILTFVSSWLPQQNPGGQGASGLIMTVFMIWKIEEYRTLKQACDAVFFFFSYLLYSHLQQTFGEEIIDFLKKTHSCFCNRNMSYLFLFLKTDTELCNQKTEQKDGHSEDEGPVDERCQHPVQMKELSELQQFTEFFFTYVITHPYSPGPSRP